MTAETRTEVEQRYRELFPVLDAYLTVLDEHARSATVSINEPAEGVDTRWTTARALERIGRPARDGLDVAFAETYIRRLRDEMESEFPEVERKLADYVIDGLYSLGGCVPTVEDWNAYSEEEQAGLVCDEIVAPLSDHPDDLRELLSEAMLAAMPAILAEISAADEARRRRDGFGIVGPAA